MSDASVASAGPAARKPRGKWGAALFMVVLMLVAGLACWLLKGGDAVLHAAETESALLLTIIPTTVMAMLLAGLMQALIPKSTVSRLMGESSGWKGLLIGTIAGTLTPGGPIASFPLVAALAAAGADFGSVVAYLTAWSTLGLSKMVVWEIPLLGADFAFVRFVVSLPLPFIAGLAARAIAREAIRR